MTDVLEREVASIASITRLGLFINGALAVVKLAVGWFVGSLALIADGFNSLTDLITDFAVLIGTAMGARPADESHPYGHGKIETFVALIVDLGVLIVGGGIMYSAVRSLTDGPNIPSNLWAVVIVAAATIILKEWLFHRTTRIADKSRSAALRGKAWDHRADVAVSGVVLLGGIGALFGWKYGDVIPGLVVGVVILGVGGRLAFDTLIELTEGSAGRDTESRIGELLDDFTEVRGWHRLRTRRIGRELLIDVHIMLNPDLTVESGHAIVRRIESALAQGLDWPVNLTIHIDPDNYEIRSAREAVGDRTLKL